MMPSYPLALPNVAGPVFVLDAPTLERGLKASRESPRRRITLPLHRGATEGVQRMLSFIQRGSYIRPHYHPAPASIEHIVAVQGALGFLVFDEHGTVLTAHRLEAGHPAACLIDIEQGLWHTGVPLADDTVIVEIKRGPYNAATDKIFAQWAPEEGTPEVAAYVRRLEAQFGTADGKSRSE